MKMKLEAAIKSLTDSVASKEWAYGPAVQAVLEALAAERQQREAAEKARKDLISALKDDGNYLMLDVIRFVTLLNANEWAEHVAKTAWGRFLESDITALINANAELREKLARPVVLPDPSQDKWLQWSGDHNFRAVAYFSAVKAAIKEAGYPVQGE